MKIIRHGGGHGPHSFRDMMDRFFDDSWDPFSAFDLVPFAGSRQLSAIPRLDVYETEKEVIIEADISGYDPKKIEIEVVGDLVSIHGKMEEEKEDKDKKYYRRERSYGEFHRQVALPSYADSSSTVCRAKNGTLVITIPKRTEHKKKPIPVEVE